MSDEHCNCPDVSECCGTLALIRAAIEDMDQGRIDEVDCLGAIEWAIAQQFSSDSTPGEK